jgi:hypothetical protein
MGRNGVLGVVVPIHDDEVMHDIFHGRSVHASLAQGSGTDLEKGDRIFFYDARETRSLRGEAVIADISFKEARHVLDGLWAKLYLEKDDFERYIASLPERDKSKLRVLHFKDPVLYANPVKCDLAIAENGTYMTAEFFAKIAKGI